MNRLAQETSPYLLQHADNPVDWYPWGEEALARARSENKPVLLSVGYAACHWCHVMEHESFEDEQTAARGLAGVFDPSCGWCGSAPKFPPASALELLMRRGELDMVTRTLDAMAAGGMYDLVGGGFHRYSVDERWLVPHFEKMLYDNALLVPAYLHGWLVTGEARYRGVVEQTVEYALRDLRLRDGGFASSQDADTDGVEGLTYTWAPGEGAPEELLEPFEEGRFILRGELDEETRARLLEIRSQRP